MSTTGWRVTGIDHVAFAHADAGVPDQLAETLGLQCVATEMASGPTAAYGSIRRLLDAGDRSTLADQLEAEAASIAACADDPEGRAGVAAFTAGRSPVFH